MEKSRDVLKAALDAKSDSILELESRIDVLAQEKNCVESDARAAQEKSAREISSLSSSLAIAKSTVYDLRTESQTQGDIFVKQNDRAAEDAELIAQGINSRTDLEAKVSVREAEIQRLHALDKSRILELKNMKDERESVELLLKSCEDECKSLADDVEEKSQCIIETRRDQERFENACKKGVFENGQLRSSVERLEKDMLDSRATSTLMQDELVRVLDKKNCAEVYQIYSYISE